MFLHEKSLEQLERGAAVAAAPLRLRQHEPAQHRRNLRGADLDFQRSDQALVVRPADREVVPRVVGDRVLVHHLDVPGVEVGGAGEGLEVIGGVQVDLPDRGKVLRSGDFQVNQWSVDSGRRRRAHRKRTAFCTRTLP